MHISRPPSASAMLDAASVCIDERKKSRNKYFRGELLFYAQRRGFVDVSAHRLHIKGCSFGRPSEQILRFAQNDIPCHHR